MNTPRQPWNPDSHAALYAAAHRRAAELRSEAIAEFWRAAARALQRMWTALRRAAAMRHSLHRQAES